MSCSPGNVIPLLALLATMATASPGSGEAQASTQADAAVRRLRLATRPTRDNAHIRTMFALRQLQDPQLEPLFRHLAMGHDWQMQVHAVLGLAEVGEHGTIEPTLVRQIRPPGQEHLIIHALREEFLSAAQMESLLHDPQMLAMPRLLLLAELSRTEAGTGQQFLDALVDHDDLRVAGLTACLRAEQHGQEALSDYRHRLAGLSRRDREQHRAWILDLIREYELSAALPIVHDALADTTVRRAVLHAGLRTLIQLDTNVGLATWQQFLGQSPSHSKRVRFGMLLLEAQAPIPTDTFELIRNDEPLTTSIIEAGLARTRGIDQSPAAIDLLDRGHLASTEWVMEHALSLPPSQSVPIYEHLLMNLITSNGPANDRVTLAIRAIERLFETDPQKVLDRLADVEDDSQLQQVLLLGLFESTLPLAGHAAETIPRSGPKRADSIALVLLARHSQQLTATDLAQLGVIAGGGGRVSEMLQTQAAWLYLKHTGKMGAALQQLCAVGPSTGGPPQ